MASPPTRRLAHLDRGAPSVGEVRESAHVPRVKRNTEPAHSLKAHGDNLHTHRAHTSALTVSAEVCVWGGCSPTILPCSRKFRSDCLPARQRAPARSWASWCRPTPWRGPDDCGLPVESRSAVPKAHTGTCKRPKAPRGALGHLEVPASAFRSL